MKVEELTGTEACATRTITLMKFIAAFRFLTVIPLPFRRQPAPEEFGGSIFYFPVVGLIIGIIMAALYYVLQLILPSTMALVLTMAAMVLVHGALHVDGFIDTCDGLAGNKPAEERWKIMKDSRVGAFGVVGAVLLFLAKFAALVTLPRHLILPALVMMPLLSRWSMVYAMLAYPYARLFRAGNDLQAICQMVGLRAIDRIHDIRRGSCFVVAGSIISLCSRPGSYPGSLADHAGVDQIPELEIRRPYRGQLRGCK